MKEYPKAYIDFLAEFHGSRDYFECHELLEEYWKEVAPGQKDSVWVSLIQLAVALYHERRGNFRGAVKMIEQSSAIAHLHGDLLVELGIRTKEYFALLTLLQERMSAQSGYFSVNIPLESEALAVTVKKRCVEKKYVWHNTDTVPDYILHRHMRRDRSDVIALREAALREKQRNGDI